jgi:hypothetical protein
MAEAFEMSMDVQRKFQRPARGWVIAPTYDLAMEEWRIALEMFKEVLNPDKTSVYEKRMMLWEGTEIEFKSADSKDTTLRGAGLDWAILAEAARIPQEAWEQGIRPALSDRLGRAVFGSTPKGRNWFYYAYLLGQGEDKDWRSWHLPSNSRPSFPPQEWEDLKRTLPQMVFRQEFEAEFLEDDAGVFKNISACVKGKESEPEKDHHYVMGVDLARLHDFTVLTVMDTETRHLVYFDRFNQVSWHYQKQKIELAARRYNNAKIMVDSTGVGDPIWGDLQKMGLRAEGYKFTQVSKRELIELLMLAIENKLITFPEIPVLINELRAYEIEILKSGKPRFGAPEGENFFDDCVISLALAVMGMRAKIFQRAKVAEKDELAPLDDRSYEFWDRWKKSENQDREDYKIDEVLDNVT